MLSRIYRTDSEIRKRQINTLKIFNDNVTEIQEGSEYQVLFQSGANELILHVLLTSEFPNTKPLLKINPHIYHPWISTDGEIISAPGLLNFSIYSDLGRVVQAIIREFERTPPPLATEPCSSVTSPTVPMRESEAVGRGSPSYYINRQSFSPPNHSLMPNYQSGTFPELGTLPIEELQFLNESMERREEFLDNLPQNKETNKILDDLILQIEELADSNLSKESVLIKLREEIDQRIEEVTKLAFENERLNVSYQNLSDKYAPKNIKNKLLLAAEEANNNGDKIAESFLKGSIDVEKFLSEFLQTRTLGQTRKTKEEKLSQQLKNLERAGF